MAEYDEEQGSEFLDFDAINATAPIQKKYEDPDEEYAGEWGYSLVKSLRGRTVGRRLKRNLFKFGGFQISCSFALLVICILLGECLHWEVLFFDLI
jgi:hypothetical protein